jgi:hypothetical protein
MEAAGSVSSVNGSILSMAHQAKPQQTMAHHHHHHLRASIISLGILFTSLQAQGM